MPNMKTATESAEAANDLFGHQHVFVGAKRLEEVALQQPRDTKLILVGHDDLLGVLRCGGNPHNTRATTQHMCECVCQPPPQSEALLTD